MNEPHPSATPAGPPIIELRAVSLDFDDKPILRRLNLRVERGQRMVIMGQSGAGKSTLLRLVLGILQPSAGTVLFDGAALNLASRRQMNAMRRRMGMVYQSSALISSLSVRDNLALPLEELTHKHHAEIDRIVEEKLALVGMEETGPLMPAELSGGMRKRVAIARALVMEPELLLFDEPTTGLDPVLAAVIDGLIIQLSERTHATSIIVTHELTSAFRVATRMAMLFHGRIVEEARPERFRTSSNPVVEQFIEGRTEGPIS
ncbi:MAG: ATP-binding cassette domain-containing protein [Chthoniobacteraceae bacterium]|nr:ATP-binding cassette domain-containing protein [Chthoniobacteraceae bacterium]